MSFSGVKVGDIFSFDWDDNEIIVEVKEVKPHDLGVNIAESIETKDRMGQ